MGVFEDRHAEAWPWDLRIASVDRDCLGEAPVWDDRRRVLTRVDILNGRVLELHDSGESSVEIEIAAEVSAAVPRALGGLILAVGHELIAIDRRGARETLAIVEADVADNRFNDCRCDPQGRLWAGTMSKSRTPNQAGLYRLLAGEPITRMLSATTLSNGLGWSPDGDLMYFIDSTTQRLDVFDFDQHAGTIHDRRQLTVIPSAEGLPDGLTVDREGGIWVCLFGGGALRRYAPDGELDSEIRLPVTNPTCATFGGEDLGTLYVTSARHRLSAAQLANEPFAGAVLTLRPGVAGLPLNRFAM